MAIQPPVLIEAPGPVPQAPPGLFDVALGPLPFPEAAAIGGGVEYVPVTCSNDAGLYPMECPTVDNEKVFTGIDTAVSGAPFGVYASYTCGVIGYTFDEVEDRARTRLLLREQRMVEQRLWSGQAGVEPGDTDIVGLFAGATVLPAADCPTEAVSVLEGVLAANGIVGGMIHATTIMSPYLARDFQLVQRSPRTFSTNIGTPYVFGQGYDGTGPSGQPATATTEWMYATGRVVVWREQDVSVPPSRQTMDRTLNQMYVLAERIYAVAVECGVWAVQVTRDC